MREIKFRVFIEKVGWVIPSHGVHAIDFVSMKVKVDVSGLDEIVEYDFDEVELMQYTGLREDGDCMENDDKREVYEGDIIKECGFDDFYIVEFKDSKFIARKLKRSGGIFTRRNKDLDYVMSHVIWGNIFENPELLEGEKQ